MATVAVLTLFALAVPCSQDPISLKTNEAVAKFCEERDAGQGRDPWRRAVGRTDQGMGACLPPNPGERVPFVLRVSPGATVVHFRSNQTPSPMRSTETT